MVNEEKELFKFINDPNYRGKIIEKIHRAEDKAYDKRIKTIKIEKDKLNKNRTNEITRISNSRWKKYANGKLQVNRTEGKIRINGVDNIFSSIQGAELNMMSGCRVLTTENTQTKSKKHASIGGAVAGGLIAGPFGAVVGGSALGKTKGKTTGTTVSNQIPTCTHLGVLVNIGGFISEIVLISNQVDQSSVLFTKAQREAQNIISQLGVLANTPVPTSFLRPDEEQSVKNIDLQITNKQQELETAIADKPTYNIPKMYRTEEQKDLSDDEYLQYLIDTDEERARNCAEKEAQFKREQEEARAATRQKKAEEKVSRQHARQQKMANIDYIRAIKNVGGIIYKIVFWFFSVCMILFMISGFVTGRAISGILFLITGVLINPLVDDLIRDKLFKMPKWLPLVILIVGFLAAIIAFPTTESTTDDSACIEYGHSINV